jgi:hypothetical protein
VHQSTGLLDLLEGPNYGTPDPQEEESELDNERQHENWTIVDSAAIPRPRANVRGHVPIILERQSFFSRLGLGFPPRSSRAVDLPPNISEESFFSPGEPAASNSLSGSDHRHSHGPGQTPGPASGSIHPRPSGEAVVAPHARMQLQRPLVRPLSGLHQEHLGSLYDEIKFWRGRLKALNILVSEDQTALYDDIRKGAHLRGWLLVGKGVRFLPGIRMIEGRSKDDIRWSDLQNESGRFGTISFWIIVAVVCIILAGSRECSR